MGRKKITHKKCPRCEKIKPRDEYYEYWSNPRQAYRVDSRCKECSLKACRPARKRWFERNRKQALEKLREWGQENSSRLKKYQYEFNKACVREVKGSYLNSSFKKYTGLDPKKNPDLVIAYKTQLLIKRKIYEKQNDRPQ